MQAVALHRYSRAFSSPDGQAAEVLRQISSVGSNGSLGVGEGSVIGAGFWIELWDPESIWYL